MEKNFKSLKQVKGGIKILKWIDDCPNDLFSALTFQGGKAWRKHFKMTLKMIKMY